MVMERAGRHGGVDMDLMEQHGDDRTHQAGNDHRHDEGKTDAAGEQERLPPRIGFEEVDIAAEEAQRQTAEAHR